MEKGVALLDFENTDQMVQIHDYEGVSLSGRDANSKNAATEATNIFSSHYPELLVSNFPTVLYIGLWVSSSHLTRSLSFTNVCYAPVR